MSDRTRPRHPSIGSGPPVDKLVDVATALADVPDGASVASVGVIGWITPDALLRSIGDRFADTGHPRDLTFFFPVAVGDSIDLVGMDRVAREGLMKRLVTGSTVNPRHPARGTRPALTDLIARDAVEAYSWPIGATMHWLREVARRSPGYLTRVGLGTYVDPRLRGGRMTPRSTEALVELLTIKGEELLFYPTWPLHFGLLRASTADETGNLSFEREPLSSSSLALAMAVKACGGTVVAQVERMAPRRSRPARDILVPGSLVDRVVVVDQHLMTTDTPFDARFMGTPQGAGLLTDPMPMSPDKVIARRASREIEPGVPTIFGFGASSSIPQVMAEDGLLTDATLDDYIFTTEHGSFGGIVMGGWQFSANLLPTALIDGPSQFDLIDGGHCRTAALAFAEYDAEGVVNVSRFGASNPGAGGYIDIAMNARKLVLTGTFTTGGLEVECRDGGLVIRREGAIHKFVAHAQDVTYRVAQGVQARGQECLIVTERAVFDVEPEGLALIEVAHGVDVRRDILDRMGFAPTRIADPLPSMDPAIFADQGPGVSGS
jgi:propionate CoA-transferase